MTIEFQGHVQSLSLEGARPGEVVVTLRVEASRSLDLLKIHAKRGEVEMYKPGTRVTVSVRPVPGQ